MTKGKSTWKYNKLLTARRNYFLGGGTIHGGVTTTLPPAKLPTYNEPKPATTTGGGGIGAAGFAAIGTQTAADIGKLINAIDSSDIKEKADSMINQASAGQMSTQTSNDNFDTLTSDWVTNANIPHVTAKQMGAKNAGQMFGSAFAAGNQGFAAGASTGNMWAAAGSAAASTGLDIIGNIIRNKKAKKQAARVNQVIDYTRDFNERSLLNRAENLIDTQMSDLQATYAAYGGPINRYGKGGSIHIKPENRGKFTETKRRTGKTTEELTHSSNPLTRKRAIFALNSRHWNKHSNGGTLAKEEINPGLDAMVKARLALDSHFGNPTARRMTNYDTRSYTFPDGRRGNVYVGSYGNHVTPQIQDVDGELKFIEDPWSEENWERSEAQSMEFESPRDAEYFAKNYKRFAPMMSLYSKGGRLNNNSYEVGQVYDVDEATINKLKNLGYEFDIL